MSWKIAVSPMTDVLVRRIRFVVHSGEPEPGRPAAVLKPDGTVIHVAYEDTDLPEDAHHELPLDAWKGLCEQAAGQSHLGAENKVLREWLSVERKRIDEHWERRPQ